MISIFKKLIGKTQAQKAEEARIEKITADAKNHPLSWDGEKMGDEAEVRTQILNRLLSSTQKPKRRVKAVKNWSIAASILIVFGAAWYALSYVETAEKSVTRTVMVITKTKRGETKKLILSDGSSVWLNGNTSIRYPERFLGEKREVELIEGEAYFDIKHNERKPFQVKAGKTLTNVLGTAFNITSYHWLGTINVSVSKGKVAVNNHILLPNDQLAYSKANGESRVRKMQSSKVISWMQGQLVFNNESMQSLARQLEDKFFVEIRFADKKIAESHITGRFEWSESIYNILEAISLTNGLSYETKGSVITINN